MEGRYPFTVLELGAYTDTQCVLSRRCVHYAKAKDTVYKNASSLFITRRKDRRRSITTTLQWWYRIKIVSPFRLQETEKNAKNVFHIIKPVITHNNIS